MDRRGLEGRTRRVWVLGACAMACAPNSAAFGGGGGGGVHEDDTADDGSTDPGSGTGATSQGSADGTGAGTGAATDGDGGSTTNPPPPPPPPPIDTGNVDTAGDTGGSSTGEDVPPPAAEELLEHATFGGCIEPLWCYSGSVFSPAGGAMWMQECFTASLAPPFELVELELVVRGLAVQVSNVDVEVYASNGAAGPGALLGSRSVDVGNLVIGTNTIVLDTPISLNQASICIGVAAPDAGLGGALGVSVNETFTQGDASFFRLTGGGGCNHPGWTDVIDLNPNPSGNWCIRGTIREL